MRCGSRRGDGLQARSDVVERLVPAHPLEAPFALRAHALQRMQHALGVVGALEIAATLVHSAPRVVG